MMSDNSVALCCQITRAAVREYMAEHVLHAIRSAGTSLRTLGSTGFIHQGHAAWVIVMSREELPRAWDAKTCWCERECPEARVLRTGQLRERFLNPQRLDMPRGR